MGDLSGYLDSNSKDIVDLMNKNYIPPNMTSEPAFHNLATKLQEIFVHNHGGKIGGRDQAHNVLAMAIANLCGVDGFQKLKPIEEFIQKRR
jgi:hypothetical protein